MTTVSKITEQAKRLLTLAPREKFLVLEVTPQGANALFLSVDEDRKMIFEKIITNADLKKFLKSPFRRMAQKSWEGEYFFKGHRKVIVSADPSLATTMPIPLELARERSRVKDEITLTELENLIAQAMAKIFTQCRSEAAKRIGVDDIHAILVGAKADRFRIDNHAIMNPIGFTGKKISLLLELTFTSREVFENLKQFFNSPEEFFFVESPQAWLLATARARELPVNLLAMSGDAHDTGLFVFEKAGGEHPILYREKFDWSFGRIFELIAGELGVSAAIAEALYEAYRADELSPNAARSFRKIFQPAIDALLKEVEHAKIRGFVYLDTKHSMPFDLPYKHKGATFEQMPLSEILTELDLAADDTFSKFPSQSIFRNLAPFFAAYFAKGTSEINQKLRRRLHWLV